MKNYLLIILGKFESEELCREMALCLTPIVDSPHLKFNHMEGSLVFHFATEVDKPDLSDYVHSIFTDFANVIILTEMNDNVSVFLPEPIRNHLLDLDKDHGDIEMKVNLNREMIDEDGEDDNFVALLLSDIKNRIPKPSLDYILDKIKDKGYNSLSQFEKDTLDEYSK
jgi:hypothetical protein